MSTYIHKYILMKIKRERDREEKKAIHIYIIVCVCVFVYLCVRNTGRETEKERYRDSVCVRL